jgi:hypothetical protein
MLDVIEDAFQVRKIFLVKGVVVDGGPDHFARVEAGKMFYADCFLTSVIRRPPAATAPFGVRAAGGGAATS